MTAESKTGVRQMQDISTHTLFHRHGQDEPHEDGKKQGYYNTKIV